MALASKPKGFKTWSMAVPIKRPDNISSSKAVERGEKGFIPSYENEPRENMNFIMSNEYMRMWFKERSVYEKEFYFNGQSSQEQSKLQRRYVPKPMTRKKPQKPLPIITLKRFNKAMSKTQDEKEDLKKEEKVGQGIEEKL